MSKATHPDTLLAFEMNGVPLPASHGFPLRAIVPAWEGAYWVKWLTGLDVTDRPHDGFFVQTAYRYPKQPIAPGTVVPASEMEPLTGLAVKSLIVSPDDGATLRSGVLRVAGFAWTGDGEIARVDISTDGGTSWQPTSLGRDRERYAWRAFAYEWRGATAGTHTVMARATDSRGRTQTAAPPWNPSGYLWNAPDRVTVTVGGPAAPPNTSATEDLALPTDADTALARQKCVVCHDADLIAQQRLNEAGWSREIDKMTRWGASLNDDERRRLLGTWCDTSRLDEYARHAGFTDQSPITNRESPTIHRSLITDHQCCRRSFRSSRCPTPCSFPNVFMPLHIFEARYRTMVSEALAGDRIIGMVLLKAGFEAEYNGRPPIFPVGCAGVITHSEPLQDGRFNIVLKGIEKFRVTDEDRSRPVPSGDRSIRSRSRCPTPNAPNCTGTACGSKRCWPPPSSARAASRNSRQPWPTRIW